jgi:hypothetical protein
MVIEDFRNGDPEPVHDRFVARGRMLPEGVTYHARRSIRLVRVAFN